jgi:hypothetical protein
MPLWRSPQAVGLFSLGHKGDHGEEVYHIVTRMQPIVFVCVGWVMWHLPPFTG